MRWLFGLRLGDYSSVLLALMKSIALLSAAGLVTVAGLAEDDSDHVISTTPKYIFKEHYDGGYYGGPPTVITVLDARTKRVVARLSLHHDVYDTFPAESAISSADGKFIAYAVGTASAGTKIRMFELTPHGPKEITVNPSIDYGDAAHVYLTPIKIADGILYFDVDIDGKNSHRTFGIHSGETKVQSESQDQH